MAPTLASPSLATTGHGKPLVIQLFLAEGSEDFIHTATHPRDHSHPSSREQRLERPGNCPANQRIHALARNPIRAAIQHPFGQRFLPPRHFDGLLQFNQKDLFRNIEDGRHPTLPNGNRNNHGSKRKRFPCQTTDDERPLATRRCPEATCVLETSPDDASTPMQIA